MPGAAGCSQPEDDVERIVDAIKTNLPPASEWSEPDGYPNSLGLCVLDSIWSIGVHYDHHVVPVLGRYRAFRRAAGADPEFDTPEDLAGTIRSVGGPTEFAEQVVDNRQRTSSKNGILKADAVARGADVLIGLNVSTAAGLEDLYDEVKAEWLRIPGQRSGVSFRYLLILAGLQRIKPDRMILGFVSDALDRDAGVAESEALLLAALAGLDDEGSAPSARELDHAIWSYQRGL